MINNNYLVNNIIKRFMDIVDIFLNLNSQEYFDYYDVMNSKKFRSKKNHFKLQKIRTNYFKYKGLIILKYENVYLYTIV
jgi:hypothetical protein